MTHIRQASAAECLGPAYAVGDIHGMCTLLNRLIAKIEDDSKDDANALVIFLGDLVNRGPQSRQVVERLIEGPRHPGQRWIVLRGNHDQFMIDALGERSASAFETWMSKGGIQTLESYGVDRADISLRRARRAVPAFHIAFLDSLPCAYARGAHVFVHAGVDPGVPLLRQSPDTLLNVRETFHRAAHRLPYTVVHGHVPTPSGPLVAPGRIDVDTGAHLTGVLTAVAIRPSIPLHFISARGASARGAAVFHSGEAKSA